MSEGKPVQLIGSDGRPGPKLANDSNDHLVVPHQIDDHYDLEQLISPRRLLPGVPHVLSVAWDQQSQRLVTGTDDGTLHVWAANGGLERTIKPFREDASCLAWHPDGRHVVAYKTGNAFQVWDTHRGCLAIDPTGQQVIVVGMRSRTCRVDCVSREVTDGRELPEAQFNSAESIAWHPDRRWLALTTDRASNTLSPDGSPGEKLEAQYLFHHNDAAAFSPAGRWLTIVGQNRIAFWDAETRELNRLVFLLPDSQAIVLSPAGEVLWSTPDADKHLVYAVQQPDETDELMSQHNFLARIKAD